MYTCVVFMPFINSSIYCTRARCFFVSFQWSGIHHASVFENITYKRNTLGFILREARQQAGYSLRGLAEISGVSASQIHNIETNKYDVSLENYLRICLSLGLPPGMPLEDALIPNPSFYSEIIEKGPCPESFPPAQWDDSKNRDFISVCLGCHAAVYHYLLTISCPIGFCQHIEYPAPKMRDRYKEVAVIIDQWNSLERLNEIMALKTFPMRVLQGAKLTFPEDVMNKLALVLSGERVAIWMPFFNDESTKFIKDFSN